MMQHWIIAPVVLPAFMAALIIFTPGWAPARRGCWHC